MGIRSQLLRGAATCIVLACATTSAFAQTVTAEAEAVQPQPEETATPAGDIIVTGTRISSPNLQSAVPILSVGTEQIQRSPKLFDAVTSMPQFRNSSSNKGTLSLGSQSGAALLNLRNFGPERTLVLLNGNRFPLSNERGSSDVSLIPSQLIKRVDVITGGASAAYGSDAVAGAVNFILDTDFEGLKAEGSYGISTYGDAEAKEFSATYGTSFAGDRGSFIVSGNYYEQDPVLPDNDKRDWYARDAMVLLSATGVRPSQTVVRDGVNTLVPVGGLIISGPLANLTFNSDGTPRPAVLGTQRDSLYMVGGEGDGLIPGSLLASTKRFNLFAHAEFEISDAATIYLEGATAKADFRGTLQQNKIWGTNAPTIFAGNPFITPELEALMTAQGVTSFRFARTFDDTPLTIAEGKNKTHRALAGIRGEFAPGWTYTARVQYARSGLTATYEDLVQLRAFYAGVDAVRNPANGQIVCRSTLMGIDPDCVPINLFGPNSVSPAALDYFTGTKQYRTLTIDQWDFGFSTQRPLFHLWHDEPAILAIGYEGRIQKSEQVTGLPSGVPDYTGVRGVPASRLIAGVWTIGNFLPVSGKIKANEGFAELNMPIVNDVAGISELSLNAAVRHTEYEPTGPATTYKFGLVYEPIPDIRFRGSFSRDIRAPTFFDLFREGSPATSTNVTTPFGTIGNISINRGNVNLKPEVAKTYTVGVLLKPSFLPGFNASVDYYNIRLKDGIGSPGSAQQIANACFIDNSAQACSLVTLAPDRTFAVFDLSQINNSVRATEGVDVEASYRFDVGAGQLSLRGTMSYTPTYTSAIAGAAAVNRAGQVGFADDAGNPKWLANLDVVYNGGPLTLALSGRFISKSVLDAAFVEGVDIDDNSVPSVTYVNASVTYDFEFGQDKTLQAFVNITNLFNKAPPLVTQSTSGSISYTNANVYDTIGRYFTFGLRFRM